MINYPVLLIYLNLEYLCVHLLDSSVKATSSSKCQKTLNTNMN